MQVGPLVSYFQRGNYVKLLQWIFPEIGLQTNKFSILPSIFFSLRDNFLIWFLGNHWDSIQNRRDFFDQIAVEHNFDPLIASNWYSAELDKDEGKALVCDASHTKLCLKFHLEPLHDNGILSR